MEKELINLKDLSNIKCVKAFSTREFSEMRGIVPKGSEANRQYFTCMNGDKKLVIIRSQSRNNGEYTAIADENGLVGDFSHSNRYYNFPNKHEGIDAFDYETGADFEGSLDAAVISYDLGDKNKEMEKMLDLVHSSDVIRTIYTEQFKKLEEKELRRLTPYKQVAKDALISWNGLSEEEATKKVQSSTNEQLESEVYAQGSINNAIDGILAYIGNHGWPLNSTQYATAKNMVMNSPTDSHAMARFFSKYIGHFVEHEDENKNWKTEMALSALTRIHDGWVKDNQKKFMARDKKYQHMPIELIGWKEVKSDLLFLNPILQSMGIEIPEADLEKAYDNKVKDFFKHREITSIDELGAQISSEGAKFYKALEGQEDILEALQNPEFVSGTLLPSIKEKGIGADEHAMKRIETWKNRKSGLAMARARKQELKKEEQIISETEHLIDEKENDGKGDING